MAESRAVLVDLDGTLLDSMAAQVRCWSRWAAGHGLDPEPFIVTHGFSARDKIGAFAPWLDVDREVARIAADETADTKGVAALPGAQALLRGPWPLAIVTAATRDLALARLGAAGLPVPATIVTAEDVSAGKPDPAGYLRAARALGYEPGGCDVLEDAPAGVLAGRAAGMRVYAVATTCGVGELRQAHHVVRDVAAYIARFRR